jgi:pentatricopeptide repeat protein
MVRFASIEPVDKKISKNIKSKGKESWIKSMNNEKKIQTNVDRHPWKLPMKRVDGRRPESRYVDKKTREKHPLLAKLPELVRDKNFDAILPLLDELTSLPNFALPLTLAVCHKAEHRETALMLLDTMRSRKMTVDEQHLVCLIRCISDDHDTDVALEVVRSIDKEKMKLRSFLPILNSLSQRGDIKKILSLVDEMKELNIDLTGDVLVEVLSAYAHSSDNDKKKSQNEVHLFIRLCKDYMYGLDYENMRRIMKAFSISSVNNLGIESDIENAGVLIDNVNMISGTVIYKNNSNNNNNETNIQPNKRINVVRVINSNGDMNNMKSITERVIYKLKNQTTDGHVNSKIIKNTNIAPLHLVAVDETSCRCPNCGSELKPAVLDDEDRANIRLSLRDAIRQGITKSSQNATKALIASNKRLDAFDAFLGWLERRPEYTHVVDGPNVAYYGQNHEGGGFNYRQILSVVQKIEEDHPNARVLVLLPNSYTLNIIPNSVQHGSPKTNKKTTAQLNYLTGSDKIILDTLRSRDQLYCVPQASNDDWYWIYMAVANRRPMSTSGIPARVITNDKMRDHSFKFMGSKALWKLYHSQIIGFDYMLNDKSRDTVDSLCNDLVFFQPGNISREIQEQSDRRWHIPVVGMLGDDDTLEDRWLCMKLT